MNGLMRAMAGMALLMCAACGGTAENVKDDVVDEAESAGDTVENVGDDISDEAKGIVGDDAKPPPAEDPPAGETQAEAADAEPGAGG